MTTGSTYQGYTAYGHNDTAEFTGVDAPEAQEPGAEPYNVYRYNAKRWDQASGSYDMGFRDYSPGLNRFLSRDMYTGALADLNLATSPWNNNRYAFTGGNPITRIELDGHRLTCGDYYTDCTRTDQAIDLPGIGRPIYDAYPTDDDPSAEGGATGAGLINGLKERWPVTEFDIWLWHDSNDLDYEESWVRTEFDVYLWEQLNGTNGSGEQIDDGNLLLEYGYLQLTWCWLGCASATAQGGHVQLQAGGLGLGGWGAGGGANDAKVEEQGSVQGVACGGMYVVGCVQGGPGADGHDPWIGGGVAGTFGRGVQLGMMGTVVDYNIRDGGLSIFGIDVSG